LLSTKGEKCETKAATSDLMFEIDRLQVKHGEGPGAIMERYNVDAIRAFEMLRELSQSANEKLVDLAQRVIDTRGS
jgi:hypothetical protein